MLALTLLLYLSAIHIFEMVRMSYLWNSNQWEYKSLVQNDYAPAAGRGIFTCVPMQDMALHGLSTRMTFDECVDAVEPANTTNVVKHESVFVYEWTTVEEGASVVSPEMETTASAIMYYNENFGPEALCAPLQKNAPFQCTGSEPKSTIEILGLSYAITQLAFSVLGSLLVFFLYRPNTEMKKKKEDLVATGRRKALQEVDTYNRAGVGHMDSSDVFDAQALLSAKIGRLEVDNAAMKEAIARIEEGLQSAGPFVVV